MPASVPAPEQSTVFGVIDFESDDGFEESTVRIGVNDSVLANSTLERDEVTVYQHNGTVWEPLSTSVTAQQENRTVYEATMTRGTTYAVGRMTADIAIENTSYGITLSADGPRLYVNARLRNAAPIAGTYTGVMRVNGESVNRTTVAVPASGDANISLTHGVTEAGSYNLRLNRTSVGSVFISESQAAATQPTESRPASETPTGTAAATPSGDSGDDSGPIDAVPSTVFGINTLYVVSGLAIALAAFVAILLLLRRGGDGGGGQPETFDPW
ncbi:PGF-pre-PGF domain-containing protein [Halomicroarcula sp. GCM10025894]